MTTENVQFKNRNLTFFHTAVTIMPILFVIVSVGFTYAMDVRSNTKEVIVNKKAVKELQNVRLDINRLENSNIVLTKDVEYIKESQARTEQTLGDIDSAINALIEATRTQPEKHAKHAVPQVIYMLPQNNQYSEPQYQAPQYQAPQPRRRQYKQMQDQDRRSYRRKW